MHWGCRVGHADSEESKANRAANLKAFNIWLSENGKKLASKPDKAVIYAGHDPAALRRTEKLLNSDPDMSKMWRKIEALNKEVKEHEGQTKYDLLTDVLERCTNTPELLNAQGPEAGTKVIGMKTMLIYTKLVGNEKYGYVDKNKIQYMWDKLSAAYVENSKGEVTLLEGRTAVNKRVTIAFTMVREELEKLWQRKDLPDATKKNAALMIAGLEKHYDGQVQMGERIVKEAREVMKQARIALKGR